MTRANETPKTKLFNISRLVCDFLLQCCVVWEGIVTGQAHTNAPLFGRKQPRGISGHKAGSTQGVTANERRGMLQKMQL